MSYVKHQKEHISLLLGHHLPPALRIFIPSLEPPAAFIITACDKPYGIEDNRDQGRVDPETAASGEQPGATKGYNDSCADDMKTDHPWDMVFFFRFFEIVDYFWNNKYGKQDVAYKDYERQGNPQDLPGYNHMAGRVQPACRLGQIMS